MLHNARHDFLSAKCLVVVVVVVLVVLVVARLTTAVERDVAQVVVPVEQYPDVGPGVRDLPEGQRGHVAPVLEGGPDGGVHGGLLHVGGVVVQAVRQALLAPAT